MIRFASFACSKTTEQKTVVPFAAEALEPRKLLSLAFDSMVEGLGIDIRGLVLTPPHRDRPIYQLFRYFDWHDSRCG